MSTVLLIVIIVVGLIVVAPVAMAAEIDDRRERAGRLADVHDQRAEEREEKL